MELWDAVRVGKRGERNCAICFFVGPETRGDGKKLSEIKLSYFLNSVIMCILWFLKLIPTA